MSELPFPTRLPTVLHSIITLGGLALWISVGLFVLEAGLHGVLLMGVVWVVLNCLPLGAKLEHIREAMRMAWIGLCQLCSYSS